MCSWSSCLWLATIGRLVNQDSGQPKHETGQHIRAFTCPVGQLINVRLVHPWSTDKILDHWRCRLAERLANYMLCFFVLIVSEMYLFVIFKHQSYHVLFGVNASACFEIETLVSEVGFPARDTWDVTQLEFIKNKLRQGDPAYSWVKVTWKYAFPLSSTE